MSVTLPGSRAVDDRRRRRLAVSGDAPGADTDQDASAGYTVLRERVAELPSASPWLPLGRWKRVAVMTVFWGLLGLVGWLICQPHFIPAPVSVVWQPLTVGATPKLVSYTCVVLWLLAAELAGIVGWYRSHSLLDFSGRYRRWGWVTLVLLGESLLAGTQLHLLLVEAYADQLTWLTWRRETLAWLGPQVLLAGLTFFLMDRDCRRCTSSVVLLRLSAVVGLVLTGGLLATPEIQCEAWYLPAMLAGQFLALGLLVTGLWRQALYVAYICPDPPVAKTGASWLGLPGRVMMLLVARWWRPAEEAVEEPAPKRRRRRKAAEDGEEETPAPKRRRKTAATKTKRKTRTRTKPESEEGYEEVEETGEDAWGSQGEDSSAESEEAEDAGSSSESDWEEDELERLEALTRPAGAPTPVAASSKSRHSDADESEEESGEYGGIDDGHSSSDQLKGLSKRQRRELKKQQRDGERDDRRR